MAASTRRYCTSMYPYTSVAPWGTKLLVSLCLLSVADTLFFLGGLEDEKEQALATGGCSGCQSRCNGYPSARHGMRDCWCSHSVLFFYMFEPLLRSQLKTILSDKSHRLCYLSDVYIVGRAFPFQLYYIVQLLRSRRWSITSSWVRWAGRSLPSHRSDGRYVGGGLRLVLDSHCLDDFNA